LVVTIREITSKPLNTSATMLVALENNNIAISYDSIRTKQPLYTQLRQKLSSYYALEKDSLKPFNHGKLNDTIPELIAVKKHLIFLNQLADSIESNAIYTTATAQSIKDFQTKKKLKSTGYTDPKTIEALLLDETISYKKIGNHLFFINWIEQDGFQGNLPPIIFW